MEKVRRATKPDAQGFDEIRITTTPRYKTSGLSGDEWRISGTVQFFRKGRMIHEIHRQNVEGAVKFLVNDYYEALDNGLGYYGGEDDFCDQEGCAEKATVVYRLKKEFCTGGGNCGQEKKMYGETIRMFCERHSKRGDCGLEDADSNYEIVRGYPIEPRAEDKKEALFGGTVTLSDDSI